MKSVEKGGAVPHLGVIISNCLMNSHTLNDKFLKENLEWVAKCTNWARFTATASLGAIHMGNLQDGLSVMTDQKSSRFWTSRLGQPPRLTRPGTCQIST